MKQIAAFLILLVCGAAAAGGEVISFSLKKCFVKPLSGSLIAPPVDALNERGDRMADLFGRSQILEAGYKSMDSTEALAGTGGEVELFVSRKISLALGLEYCRSSRSGAFSARSLISDAPYCYSREFRFDMKMIPLMATFRYHLRFGRFDISPGAGIGYYRIQVQGSGAYEDILEKGEDLYWRAIGTGWIPHIQMGMSFRFFKGLALAAAVDRIFGRLHELEVRESDDPELIGLPLVLKHQGDDSYAIYRPALDGLCIKIMLKHTF